MVDEGAESGQSGRLRVRAQRSETDINRRYQLTTCDGNLESPDLDSEGRTIASF